MSPAYNINDLTESCTRMEIAISNLQKDVRDLKDMKSKIDSIYSLLEKFNETQGATAFNNRAPQIHTGVMDAQDSFSILSQNERDIHKPTLKGTKYRKGAYVRYFLCEIKSELKINLEDSLETRNQKNDILQALVSQLNSFTRTCVLQLINELDEKKVPEDMRSWKQVPDFMKDKCFLSLELMASSAKISLDRCVNSWAAKKLVSTNYHNAIRRNQDVKGKRVTSRVVGENQQESLPNDISTPSDTDDLPSIGSDDEEEALSEYSEPEQDVEEEASAPTDSSSVKRKGRQASSSSVSKKSRK